jgi:ATP-binding cassette, subfamily B, bacterial
MATSPSSTRRHGPPAALPSLRQRIEALRYVAPFLRLVWQTHAPYTVTMSVLRVLRAFLPVAVLWVGKLIVDEVMAIRAGADADLSRLWQLVLIEVALALVGEALARASALVESLLGDLFSNVTSVRLMRHAATLDLYQFENPDFYDRLDRARRQTTGRIGLLAQLLTMAQDALTIASLGAALLIFNPWLVLLLVVAVLPGFLGEAHYAALEYSLLYRWTPERRQLDYLRMLGASDRPAKEIQLFGLAPWLVDRYAALAERFFQENKRLSIRRSVSATFLSAFSVIGYYGAYALILLRAAQGALTIGTLTFLGASFLRSRDLVQRLLSGASGIYQQCLYLKDLFEFFETRPEITSPRDAPPVPSEWREGIHFDGVGFRYPDNEHWALRDVSFRLSPGERLALVGGNGAGKTTLVKLLARLYDPSEGRILLEGRDIREYDLESLRRSIGVIFQDFFRYDFPLDENIGVGEIDDVRGHFDGDRSDVPLPEIVTAAQKSLADTLLPRLRDGYRQMLGRRFEGGVDLSGGEWQKVALARAYMRDARVLILDEPTASLDARAEYDVFQRFAELMRGRMAIIISHRFSTVRMADRIVVLEQGRIVEEGSHTSLIASGGLYAELFALQAEGYR